MNRGLINALGDKDRLLVAETEPAALKQLDEDELVDLHLRVRRVRDKYVSVYRREASARVPQYGARGASRPKNRRNADRVEVFEDALARVSTRLAAVARRSASELRAERIAAARADREASAAAASASTRGSSTKGSPRARASKPAPNRKVGDRSLVSPRSVAKGADVRATGARRQAKRDAR
ncbi:MAG: hypothetical protein R2737_14645 [Candidatus Nanopelagicales bacterium]